MRTNGGHAVALLNSMDEVYGIRGPGDVMMALSDIGWVVGHSYSVYGPLLAGATSVVYEGKPVGTPDHLQWFRMLEKYRVNTVFCAPTGLRAIKKAASSERDFEDFNLSYLRNWFVAGEKADTPTLHWLERVCGSRIPVIDHYWQSESGSPMLSAGFAGSFGVLPSAAGTCGYPVPGCNIEIHPETKDILVKLPLGPAFATGMLGDVEGKLFHEKYLSQYPGYYYTGDAGALSEEEYVQVLARVDDVMNVAGHRLTTGQIEEAVMAHPSVSECAVVAKADALKGHVPVAFVVLKFVNLELEAEVVELVRSKVSIPLVGFSGFVVVLWACVLS